MDESEFQQCEKIMKHINTNNSACCLEWFKTLTRWAGFYHKKQVWVDAQWH